MIVYKKSQVIKCSGCGREMEAINIGGYNIDELPGISSEQFPAHEECAEYKYIRDMSRTKQECAIAIITPVGENLIFLIQEEEKHRKKKEVIDHKKAKRRAPRTGAWS